MTLGPHAQTGSTQTHCFFIRPKDRNSSVYNVNHCIVAGIWQLISSTFFYYGKMHFMHGSRPRDRWSLSGNLTLIGKWAIQVTFPYLVWFLQTFDFLQIRHQIIFTELLKLSLVNFSAERRYDIPCMVACVHGKSCWKILNKVTIYYHLCLAYIPCLPHCVFILCLPRTWVMRLNRKTVGVAF